MGPRVTRRIEIAKARTVDQSVGSFDDAIRVRFGSLVARISAAYRLTPRETEVLRGAALGRSTKAVASDLLCSPKTVEEYWRRIYRRFDLASRQEILARLLWVSLAARGRTRHLLAGRIDLEGPHGRGLVP
jgi:DNA-binding CsgD family transcriptional regulator